MDDFDKRLAVLESWRSEASSQLLTSQNDLINLAREGQQERKDMIDGFLAATKTQSDNYLEALKIQANSLSIPLLRDVLMPMLLKVFTFFSLLVLLLLGGVLGIKWMFGDLLTKLGG